MQKEYIEDGGVLIRWESAKIGKPACYGEPTRFCCARTLGDQILIVKDVLTDPKAEVKMLLELEDAKSLCIALQSLI